MELHKLNKTLRRDGHNHLAGMAPRPCLLANASAGWGQLVSNERETQRK